MKGYGQRVRKFHKHFRALDINASVFMQYSEHKTVHTDLLSSTDIIAHGLKFTIGITKIAGSRANQDMDGNLHVAASGLHEARAGSDSSRRQVTAKLNTLSAAALRRFGVVHGVYADFKHKTIRHGLSVGTFVSRYLLIASHSAFVAISAIANGCSRLGVTSHKKARRMSPQRRPADWLTPRGRR
jgi:hypothetical protein